MPQHLDFDAPVGFVLPGMERIGKEQCICSFASHFQPVGLDAMLDQPCSEHLCAADTGTAVKCLGAATVCTVHVADDPELDPRILLQPVQQFPSDVEALGVHPFLIADEVNAEDVRTQPVLKGKQGHVDVRFSEQVRPEGFRVEHVALLVSDHGVTAMGNQLEQGVFDGRPTAGSAVLVAEEDDVTRRGFLGAIHSQMVTAVLQRRGKRINGPLGLELGIGRQCGKKGKGENRERQAQVSPTLAGNKLVGHEYNIPIIRPNSTF